MKKIGLILATLSLAGCVTGEKVKFIPSHGQMAITRNGIPAVSSVKKQSIALLSQKNREIRQGARVPFVIAFQNRTNMPLNFIPERMSILQILPDKTSQKIEIISFEKMQQEERTRQVVAAILVGVAAGANAAAAANAGHYNSRTIIQTPNGTLLARTSGYDPLASSIASLNANIQNQQMINAAVEQGQANMSVLENQYIKEHTLLPGEWYGGLFLISPLIESTTEKAKNYELTASLGNDEHRFVITQEPIN